jgi:hypothetical protein
VGRLLGRIEGHYGSPAPPSFAGPFETYSGR